MLLLLMKNQHLHLQNQLKINWNKFHPKVNLPVVIIVDYNVMIHGQYFFDQPVNYNLLTYDIIREIATGQEDDYTNGCLLDYVYFKNYYKMIAIDLSKQEALDTDLKTMQQTSFTANLLSVSYYFKPFRCFTKFSFTTSETMGDYYL